jgi:hypothetical protein
MNNAARVEVAALWVEVVCASERRIVHWRVEVRADEVVLAEVIEVATNLIAIAGLEEQEQVLDEQVDLDGRCVAEPGQRRRHAIW